MRIHFRTPQQRDRASLRRADAERAAGIPDRTDADCRRLCTLDLRGAGGPLLNFEPRAGYLGWRARDMESGLVVDCAAIKSLLHNVADALPRTRSNDD